MLKVFRLNLFLKRAVQRAPNIIRSPVPNLEVPSNVLLHQYFFEKTSKWSDKIALECIETKRHYTYEDLRRKSLALAHFLKGSLRLQEKTCIGVLLPNLPEYPIVILASMRAGLHVTPINPNYTQGEIRNQLISANARALFTFAERSSEMKEVCDTLRIPLIGLKTNNNTTLASGVIDYFSCVTNNFQNLTEIHQKSVSSEDVALLPYSSGTTGLPKGVQLTHNNIVVNLEQTGAKNFVCFTDKDEIELAFLPFFHIYGFTFVLFHSLCKGVKLVTYPKFTSEHFFNGLREYRPTYIPTVPPVVHLINTNPNLTADDFVSLRSILCGAAPLAQSDVERFQDVTRGKVHLLQAYGMTELSPMTSIQTSALEGGIKIGGSGYLVPNTEAKFISRGDPDDIKGLIEGEEGQLLIRGPQVMKGYLNNPEATREMITHDGWLKTGDIGYYDKDGHIFITDRLKELIKVQGYQVAPAELEAIIRNHPGVRDVAVIGIPHERLGETPKAFVVRKGNISVRSEDIQRFVAEQVEKHKNLVEGVTFVDEIPRSASGKILRRELKRLFG